MGEEKKRMQSPAGCAEEKGGTAQIKYGREVGRRLPPTRIIERNDRLTGGFGKKGWLPDHFRHFCTHGGSQDNNTRIPL